MRIDLVECIGMGNDLFLDLGKYIWIEDWLRAIAEGQTSFMPSSVEIIYHDEKYYLVQSSEVSSHAFDIIQKIQALPGRLRRIPGSRMYLRVNGFDREVVIGLESWDETLGRSVLS